MRPRKSAPVLQLASSERGRNKRQEHGRGCGGGHTAKADAVDLHGGEQRRRRSQWDWADGGGARRAGGAREPLREAPRGLLHRRRHRHRHAREPPPRPRRHRGPARALSSLPQHPNDGQGREPAVGADGGEPGRPHHLPEVGRGCGGEDHSLGDGMSLLTLLMACTRSAADPSRLPAMPPLPTTRTGAIYARAARPPASAGAVALALWAWSFVVLAWHSVVDVAAFFATILFLRDPHTLFKRMKHGELQPKRMVHRSLSLDDIKLVKNAMNCTVNDVLVGVTYAALSRYYFRNSGDTNIDKDIRLRSILLVNLRPTTSLRACVNMIEAGKESDVKWGNELGFIILPFHIGLHSDPLNYVRKAKKIVDRKKSSLEVVFTHWIAEIIVKVFGLKAAGAIFHRMISHTTISFSNMIGPVEQVEFCGHPVVFIAPSGYGPPEALTVNFQSYVNTVKVNLAVDEAQFPDCHDLLEDFAESLRKIKGAALSLGKHHKKA